MWNNESFSETLLSETLNEEKKRALMERELGIKHTLNLNFSKLEHLVFLNQYATESDKEFSSFSLNQASKERVRDKNLFPRVPLQEAVLAYPTTETLIEYANSALEVVQYHYDLLNPNLHQRIGELELAWYFQEAKSMYELTLEFAQTTDSDLTQEQSIAIVETVKCIDSLLQASGFLRHYCRSVDV